MDTDETMPLKGIVFKDSNWEVQLVITNDDFEPFGMPSIPIGDSEGEITRQINENQFFFVTCKPLRNKRVEEIEKEAEETGSKINLHELLCAGDYIVHYHTRFTFDSPVMKILEEGSFWEAIKYIYQTEDVYNIEEDF